MLSTNKLIAVLAALALVVGVAALAVAAGPSLARSRASGGIPGLVSYQGYLTDADGLPMEGPVDLTFGLYGAINGGEAIWTETQADVSVTDGYFQLLLGSVSPLSAADFSAAERYLEVSVDDGSGVVDLPRQRLASVPYAMQAAGAPWSGLSEVPPGFADDLDGVEYDNLIVVARSGGDFTSVQAAIDSITDANWDNRYLIWIGPGWYDEQVTLKRFVSLRGAGKWQAAIRYAGGSASEPPDTATLTVASSASVRQLRVVNTGTAAHNAAVLVPAGTSGTALSHVSAEAWGEGTTNYGMVVSGADTFLALEHVNAQAGSGSDTNIGLWNADAGHVTAANSAFRASGGDNAYAIVNRGDGSELRASDVTAEANGASVDNVALWNQDSARAELRGGAFSGRDGAAGLACGICNDDANVGTMGVDVEGSGNSGENFGLRNDGGTAEIQGGDYHAGGGDDAGDAYGISNNSSVVAFAPSLMVREAWVHVGGASNCYAMYNEAGGNALVIGGELWAALCSGPQYGAYNTGSGSGLEINNALIMANAVGSPYGLFAGAGTRTDISHSELRADTALQADGGSGHLQFVYLNGDLTGDAGNLVCNAVTQGGTFYADGCPPEVP